LIDLHKKQRWCWFEEAFRIHNSIQNMAACESSSFLSLLQRMTAAYYVEADNMHCLLRLKTS